MSKIKDILNDPDLTAKQKVEQLSNKAIHVPAWEGPSGLRAQYDPKLHPVNDHSIYPDLVQEGEAAPEKVTRIALDFQRLASKRMTELCTGIPFKRQYKPGNEQQSTVASYIEAIFRRTRINSVNVERLNMLFSGCEVMTLWYAVEQPNRQYGFDSRLKFRCRNFSPTRGDRLYPLFDEYDDMVAMSVAYSRQVGDKTVNYYDAYTEDLHVKYSDEGGEWAELVREDITLGKIPCIYMYRPAPIWEDNSSIVEEMEWTLSRNGNYLRRNSKPLLGLFVDGAVQVGQEKKDANKEFRSIIRLPKGSDLKYVTWAQAIENLKFHIDTLRQDFFTLLQLPDWSYEKMSQQALSGESRKQLFIDAQMKVKDESGRLLEFADREVNIVKAFLKSVLPESMYADIDALQVDTEITPFQISDTKETVETLITATGGAAVMSQREAITQLGMSSDPDKTLQEIEEQERRQNDVFGPE